MAEPYDSIYDRWRGTYRGTYGPEPKGKPRPGPKNYRSQYDAGNKARAAADNLDEFRRGLGDKARGAVWGKETPAPKGKGLRGALNAIAQNPKLNTLAKRGGIVAGAYQAATAGLDEYRNLQQEELQRRKNALDAEYAYSDPTTALESAATPIISNFRTLVNSDGIGDAALNAWNALATPFEAAGAALGNYFYTPPDSLLSEDAAARIGALSRSGAVKTKDGRVITQKDVQNLRRENADIRENMATSASLRNEPAAPQGDPRMDQLAKGLGIDMRELSFAENAAGLGLPVDYKREDISKQYQGFSKAPLKLEKITGPNGETSFIGYSELTPQMEAENEWNNARMMRAANPNDPVATERLMRTEARLDPEFRAREAAAATAAKKGGKAITGFEGSDAIARNDANAGGVVSRATNALKIEMDNAKADTPERQIAMNRYNTANKVAEKTWANTDDPASVKAAVSAYEAWDKKINDYAAEYGTWFFNDPKAKMSSYDATKKVVDIFDEYSRNPDKEIEVANKKVKFSGLMADPKMMELAQTLGYVIGENGRLVKGPDYKGDILLRALS